LANQPDVVFSFSYSATSLEHLQAHFGKILIFHQFAIERAFNAGTASKTILAFLHQTTPLLILLSRSVSALIFDAVSNASSVLIVI